VSGSVESWREGSVLGLMVDRPQVRNALDAATLDHLANAITAGSADPEINAIVLTGAGSECFCAGADLKSLASEPVELGQAVRRFTKILRSAERVPVIAAVRGIAAGGGFEIALMCDLVVSSTDARFGLPEIKRGLVPGGGGTLLPSRVPIAIALELGLLGDLIDAERAANLGLVNRVCPSEDVLREAVELAHRLAGQPRETLQRIRELMWITARDGVAAGAAAAGLAD
jgi:enoyl-CoA hydratase